MRGQAFFGAVLFMGAVHLQRGEEVRNKENANTHQDDQ